MNDIENELQLKNKIAEEKFKLAKYNLIKALKANKTKLDIILKACRLLYFCGKLAEYEKFTIFTFAYEKSIQFFINTTGPKLEIVITAKKIIISPNEKMSMSVRETIQHYTALEENMKLLLNESLKTLIMQFDNNTELYKPD